MSLVKVAGIPIDIQCHDTEFFDRRLAAYITDESECDTGSLMRITSRISDIVELPKGEEIGKIGTLTLSRTEDGRYFYYGKNKENLINSCISYDPEYRQVEINQRASRRHPFFSLTDFEYMYTGMVFSNRLAYTGGLVLHASALSYKGRAIAFSAISGTGKSTHTGLWKEYFGENVEIINDDKPAVCFEGGQPYLYGTPWSGKTDINNNIKAPLVAIVFIEQAEKNSIRRISAAEAYFDMANGVARPACDESLGIKLLDTMETLLKRVPVYKMGCNISFQAVETAYNEILGGSINENSEWLHAQGNRR